MKILVLHSRLSGYWMACMRAFVETYDGTFTVIRKKASVNAPFSFDDEKGIQLLDNSAFSKKGLMEFCKEVDPDLIYVAGWSEQKYLDAARYFYKSEVPVVCGLDNHWKGNIRQQIGKFYLRYQMGRTFTHLWIPGLYQFEYASKLGFKKENILTGVYSADVCTFARSEELSDDNSFQKSFLYVGRFVPQKGLLALAEAFEQLRSKNTDWSLTLIGNGPLKEEIKQFSSITVRDFIPPQRLPQVMHNHGVFVLPSLYEPWGVVVHEAVSAGMPVISTYACGAARAFIRNGYNGYLARPGNRESIYKALHKCTQMDDKSLYKMSERSRILSKQITPQTWSATLKSLIEDK